jgi:hypothetical protein
MDFIQLANAAHETSRAIVRMLLEQQDDNDDSDDFVRIENEPSMSRYHGSSPEGTTNLQRVDDVDYSITGGGGGGVPQMEDRPFLSPTAESALLSLCTNFLLYVAMVLITVLVARIYFPSWLEPRSGVDATGGDGAPTRVREQLRALSTTFEDDDEEDDEDDDEEEEEFIGTVKINTPRREEERKKGYSDNLVDVLDADNEEVGQLIEPNNRRGKITSATETGSNVTFLDSWRLPTESMSKESVYSNLAICAIMLNVTFVSWGLLQERMLTRKYPRLTGEYFTYSYALVFTNRFWTLVMSGMLLAYFKPKTSRSTVIYEYCLPSISNMLSSWCQYEALFYVSFPAVTLFKSFKLAPVMLMGKLLGNHSCEFVVKTVCVHDILE